MVDGFITRRAGASKLSKEPTINIVSVTFKTITFTITNNDDDPTTIQYELSNPFPTANSFTLEPGATSSNLTFSNLVPSTEHTIFASATSFAEMTSNIGKLTFVTLPPSNPSIIVDGIESTLIRFKFTNPNNVQAKVYYSLDENSITDNEIIVNANSTSAQRTIDGLEPLTSYTLFAQLEVEEKLSDVVSQGFSTPDIAYTNATNGEIVEYNSDGKRYRSHTFLGNDTFSVNQVGDAAGERNKVEYLIVAGGGAGGNDFGGSGGGAGGFRTSVEGAISGGDSPAENKFTVDLTNYQVSIGAGGVATFRGSVGSGGNSSALGIISAGGGRGRAVSYSGSGAGSGGSGGGAQSSTFGVNTNGGAGTSGQGFKGGNASSNDGRAGGGASSAGTDAPDGNRPGGGQANNIRNGTDVVYASGGSPQQGASAAIPAAAGGSNTGRGGNGTNPNFSPSNASSGIVVIRYEIAPEQEVKYGTLCKSDW